MISDMRKAKPKNPMTTIFAFVLLFGTGLAYELLASKSDNAAYRFAVGIAVVSVLLLVWVNAAVGMIGDDNPANVLYVGVIAVGIMGASITRLHLHGMARTLCVMAMAQMVVPVLALILWPTDFAPGVGGGLCVEWGLRRAVAPLGLAVSASGAGAHARGRSAVG